jgi:hypothetical protein
MMQNVAYKKEGQVRAGATSYGEASESSYRGGRLMGAKMQTVSSVNLTVPVYTPGSPYVQKTQAQVSLAISDDEDRSESFLRLLEGCPTEDGKARYIMGWFRDSHPQTFSYVELCKLVLPLRFYSYEKEGIVINWLAARNSPRRGIHGFGNLPFEKLNILLGYIEYQCKKEEVLASWFQARGNDLTCL